jgi:hypothetical protein
MSETLIELGGAGAWVPGSCTLPTAERPVRVEAFTALFVEAVLGIERPSPGRLRLDLYTAPEVAARAAELVTRETRCCSFFTFTLTATAGTLTLEAAVDAAHTLVLDALAERAAAARQAGRP